jgi:hypothetical protein
MGGGTLDCDGGSPSSQPSARIPGGQAEWRSGDSVPAFCANDSPRREREGFAARKGEGQRATVLSLTG